MNSGNSQLTSILVTVVCVAALAACVVLAIHGLVTGTAVLGVIGAMLTGFFALAEPASASKNANAVAAIVGAVVASKTANPLITGAVSDAAKEAAGLLPKL